MVIALRLHYTSIWPKTDKKKQRTSTYNETPVQFLQWKCKLQVQSKRTTVRYSTTKTITSFNDATLTENLKTLDFQTKVELANQLAAWHVYQARSSTTIQNDIFEIFGK